MDQRDRKDKLKDIDNENKMRKYKLLRNNEVKESIRERDKA